MQLEDILEQIEAINLPMQDSASKPLLYKRTLLDPLERARHHDVSINIITCGTNSERLNFQYVLLTEGNVARFKAPLKETKFEMHQHDFYEMMYIYKGGVQQHVEQEKGHCEAGEFYLMNRNVNHVEQYVEWPATCVFLCFQESFLFSILKELPQENAIRKFFEVNMHDASVHNKQYMYFRQARSKSGKRMIDTLITALVQELLDKKPGYRYFLHGYIVRLFSELDQPKIYQRLYQMHDSASWLFERATQYIRQKGGRLSRQQLAQELGYSPDYLNRVFQQKSAMSLTQYFNMVKIEEAARLLRETEMTVWEIAEELGYQNKSYFYRLFENKMKMTPRSYRNSYKILSKSE